jgi:hypothetical protein
VSASEAGKPQGEAVKERCRGVRSRQAEYHSGVDANAGDESSDQIANGAEELDDAKVFDLGDCV